MGKVRKVREWMGRVMCWMMRWMKKVKVKEWTGLGVSALKRDLAGRKCRNGFGVDFVLTAIVLGIVLYIAWGSGLVDRLYDRVLISVLTALLPLGAFYAGAKGDRINCRPNALHVGLVFFFGSALAIALGGKYDSDAAVLIGALSMIAIPYFALSVWLMLKEPLLIVGVIPTAALLLLLPAVHHLSSGGGIESAPIFLYSAAVGAAVCAVAAYLPLCGVRKWRNHPTRGPAMECLAMLFLFAPSIALAVAGPIWLSWPNELRAATAVLVGVVFGGVVSNPLRQFLREFGRLPDYRRESTWREKWSRAARRRR